MSKYKNNLKLNHFKCKPFLSAKTDLLNLKAILSSQNAKSNLKLNNQELCLYGQERT